MWRPNLILQRLRFPDIITYPLGDGLTSRFLLQNRSSGPRRIIFPDVASGIGDFSVSAGKDLSGNRAGQTQSRSSGSQNLIGKHLHYVILMKKGWEQSRPLRFHNGELEALRADLRLTARVPLPDMPNFFPAGAQGEFLFQGRHVLHLHSALREQSLFSHLESLRTLVQRCAERKTTFPDFVTALNGIPIPPTWRNEIVNGLFEHAKASGSSSVPTPKAPGLSQDIEKLMSLIGEGDSGGSKLSPHLGKFLEEVGKDSTGFTLRDGAAKTLVQDLSQTLEALHGTLLRHGALAGTLGFLAALQRLARAAKGRDGQTVHLWSEIPEDPTAILLDANIDAGGDITMALVVTDAWDRDLATLSRIGSLAAKLNCPVLLQAPGEEIPPGDLSEAMRETFPAGRTYVFAGGVAAQVDGDFCIFRPAALAFLEGQVAARETVDFYEHHGMTLEDQDLLTEKGQARSTDKLLDNTQMAAICAARLNRVNGARNQSIASFPLLTPWRSA